MKHIVNFNDYKINELFVHKSNDDIDDKNFILYKKDVWIFDENEFDEIYQTINDTIGDDIFTDDMQDSFNIIRESYPYILVGSIRNNTIVFSSVNYRHSIDSDDLKKLKQLLNIDTIKVDFYRGVYSDIDDSTILKDEQKDYFYHGTSLKYINSIYKYGIKPNDKQTNFDSDKHKDKIFITKNIEKALFHANTAAQNTNSISVILKLKVPDTSKLIIDYDVSREFYGDTEQHTELYGIETNQYFKPTGILKDSEKVNIAKKIGIYGYLGRIPSSYIEDVIIDVNILQHWYIQLHKFGEHIDYDSEIWNDYNDIDMWSELSFKELLNYIEDIDEEE